MRWPQQAPFHQTILRARLRRAALNFATHGWPVTPGGYFNGTRMACDRSNCWATSCHPVLPDWDRTASTSFVDIDEWWLEHPHAVLLPTGLAFDVIEVPALLGAQAVCGPPTGPGSASAVGRVRAPVAVTAAGRWMFLVRTNSVLHPELDHRTDVVQHGAGSWIPAPPTVLPEGTMRWQVSPAQVGWQLPDSDAMQRALVHALVALDAAFLDLPVASRRRLTPARLGSLSTVEHSLRRAG